MADVGKASVEIVGDVRSFARQVQRDLNAALRRIKLKPIDVPFDARGTARGAERAGKQAADAFVRAFILRMRALQAGVTAAAFRMGNSAGDGFRRGLDKGSGDKDGFARKFLRNAGDALKKGFSGIGSVLGPVFSAIGSTVAVTFGAAFLVTAASIIAPALAAAVTSGLGLGLGAALLGIGILAVKDLKPVQNAFKELTKTIKEVGHEAAKPLIKPLIAGLRGLADLARELKGDFKGIFKDLAPAIKPLLDAVGLFLGEVVRGLADSMPGIIAAFDGLSRALPVVGRWLGDFFRTIFENSGLIDNTTEGLMKLIFSPLKLLGPIISGLNVAFGVWNNLLRLIVESNVLGELWNSLVTFADGGSGAIQRIKDAWGPLGDAIQLVWDKIKAFAGEDDAGKLAMRFQEAVEAIKAAWGPLKEFVSVIWDEMIALVQRLWEEKFMPWWNETAAPWLQEAIQAAFNMAWDAAIAVVTGRVQAMANTTWAGIARIPGLARQALAALPGVIGSAFRAASNIAMQQAARMVAGAVSVLRTLPGRARSAVGSIQQAIMGAFAGAAGWLAGAGRQIIEGLLSGIRSGFGQVRSLLGELTSMLPDWKGPEQVDKTILKKSGQLVMQGFESGLISEFGSIKKTLGGLTGNLGISRAAYGTAAPASTSSTSLTISPGAIVIYGSGGNAAAETAETILERLAQATLVHGRR
jgi:phage-related protein